MTSWSALLVAWALAPASVRWDAPAQCRPAASVDAALAELGADAGTAEIDVQVHAAGLGWRADVGIATAEGTTRRSLGETDCETLARAIALVVAVTLDPFAALRDPAVQRVVAREPTVTPGVVPPPVETTAIDRAADPIAAHDADPSTRDEGPRASRSRRRLGGAVWAVGGLDIGLFPRLFGAVGAGLALRMRGARVEAGALHLAPRRLDHPDDPSAGATVWLAAGQLRGCWVPAWRRIELPLCAGVEAGAMIAEGRGLLRTGVARFPWAAVSFGPRLAWSPADAVALVVGVDGVVSLVRPRFSIDDFERDLAHASAGTFRAFAGVELRFP